MKIALGTAQFGLAYGAFNKAGQITISEVQQVLQLAKANGIEVLDTAHAYGSSETVLGGVGASLDFNIVTKIPSLESSDPSAKLSEFFAKSLNDLKADGVYGLLLHRAGDLLAEHGPAVWRELERLRDSGQVRRIGFSAYSAHDTLEILNRYPVQLVQLPMNVFDRRHLESGVLELCQSRGVEVHVRSVFLQGFALGSPANLKGHLAQWRALLTKFQYRCSDLGITPLQGALCYALGVSGVDKIVVGVDGKTQLDQILTSAQVNPVSSDSWSELACDDLDLIDPSRWV